MMQEGNGSEIEKVNRYLKGWKIALIIYGFIWFLVPWLLVGFDDILFRGLLEILLFESINIFLVPRLFFFYRSIVAKKKGDKKLKWKYRGLWIFTAIAGLVAFVAILSLHLSTIAHKPIIYLYPESRTEVNVRLELDGELTSTYPAYDTDSGWIVTAEPDGQLTDAKGRNYSYLFWEGDVNIRPDLSRGFCVRGDETESFLEDALGQLGLTDREADDFITYWLPEMERNEYNIITFQTDAFEEVAKLEVTPEPDTVIRVNMFWCPASSYVDIEEQDLSSVIPKTREGFTVVEWGGEKYNRLMFDLIEKMS